MPVLGERVLSPGMTGDDVLELQSRLQALGLFSVSPTGYYGSITEGAVRSFQNSHGLPPTGIADQTTLAALLERVDPPEPTASPTPPPGVIIHEVAPGETLWSIARRYGVTVESILRSNPQIQSADQVTVGSRLNIQTTTQPTPPPTPTPAPGPLEVWGYYDENTSRPTLEQFSTKLTGIIGFWFNVGITGDITSNLQESTIDLARSRGLKILGLIHNWVGQSFDRPTAHAVLTDSNVRSNTIANLSKLVNQYNLDGVQFDLENIAPTDRSALTSFICELYRQFHPQGKLVTMALVAKRADFPNHDWVGAYDYAALTPCVDWFALMAYEVHYASGTPGPIAPYSWAQDVFNYALSIIPANQIVLAIGGYGYDWIVGQSTTAATVTYDILQSLLARYGGQLTFDTNERECTYSYTDSDGLQHIVWYQCPQHAQWKIQAARQLGMRGIALWLMGEEDPAFWDLLPSLR